MRRVVSIKDVTDIMIELPAGIDPYEEFDFQPYFEESKSEEELRQTWRVFTKVKDVLDDGRRLENASWRLWFKERSKNGAAPTVEEQSAQLSELEANQLSLNESLRSAEKATARMAGEMFGNVDAKFSEESKSIAMRSKAERTNALLRVAEKHGMSAEAVDDLATWAHNFLLNPVVCPAVSPSSDATAEVVGRETLPTSYAEAKEYMQMPPSRPRPRVAAFCHSLERNGANNFLLYLLRELKEELAFDIYSPKEGAMRADYEAMSMPVHKLDTKSPEYPTVVRKVLKHYDYSIANTIMTTEIINASKDLGVPCLWVIHEAWPQGQFNYYAKEVFMMAHLDEKSIIEAFSNASKIVFPAHVQQKCYAGLFQPSNARVIYNGIPLSSINAFRSVRTRDEVRAELGYGPNDMLLVHMGTVCKRKGQMVTSGAFGRLVKDGLVNGKQYKLLMVGARYIRQHEIEYIDGCKKLLEESSAMEHTTILDVKKNVLPFYLAADIILCPSLNEVLPLVICEGMAFERPVIASRIDGIPEALTDGEEGLLIEPDNEDALYWAIKELAEDEDRRDAMGQAGRKRVLDQFSFGTMSKHYRETISVDLKL